MSGGGSSSADPLRTQPSQPRQLTWLTDRHVSPADSRASCAIDASSSCTVCTVECTHYIQRAALDPPSPGGAPDAAAVSWRAHICLPRCARHVVTLCPRASVPPPHRPRPPSAALAAAAAPAAAVLAAEVGSALPACSRRTWLCSAWPARGHSSAGLQRSPIISDGGGGGGGGGGGAGQRTDMAPAADSTVATPLLPALSRRGTHQRGLR
eukprot:COSAG01_NODE_2638_length_7292_cov_8.034034_9_plen_210_part_00